MKTKLAYIYSFLVAFISVNGYSQCDMQVNFEDYTTNGMSSFIEWNTIDDNTVVCSSSDWQPSFLVNNDTLLNVKITGEVYVNPIINDDDFIGFVFGYKSPNINTQSNDNHFYLFDWKKEGQYCPVAFGSFYANEGFSLVEAKGLIEEDPVSTYRHFWGHLNNENFNLLDYRYSSNMGWEYSTIYQFELIYTYKKVKISIDGELIFEMDGCFDPGLFGLYSFNQNAVVYQNISIEQYYQIHIDNEQDIYCEGESVGFHFIDPDCADLPPNTVSFQWNFGDDTEFSQDLNPQHTFAEPGDYNVELYLENLFGCIDTIRQGIHIEANPSFVQVPHDVECFVGDDIYFVVEASNALNYQWYYKDREMDSFVILQNDGYFSGVRSDTLRISDVRLPFDKMEFLCSINGDCLTNISSEAAEIIITDIPIRANLDVDSKSVCAQDSSYLILSLKEFYNIEKARILFEYDHENLQLLDFTSYNNHINYSYQEEDGRLEIHLERIGALPFGEAIIAAFEFQSIGSVNTIAEFNWVKDSTWFIDITGDTILDILSNTAISINQPITWDMNDSISLCYGESINIESDDFNQIIWSTGATGNETLVVDDGEYWVKFEDYNSCISADTFYFNSKPLPQEPLAIHILNDFYCANEDSIRFSIDGGLGAELEVHYNDIYKYFAEPSDEYRFPNQSESFEISAAYINDCGTSSIISQNVEVHPVVIPKVKIDFSNNELFSGETINFSAIPENEGEEPQYYWLMDQIIVQFGESSVFQTSDILSNHRLDVIMYSNAECLDVQDSAYASVFVNAIDQFQYYIPSLVIANGDGKNDEFKVDFINTDFEEFEIQIYDLLGKLVFETNDPEQGWEGENTSFNGKAEMFAYRIKFKHIGQHEKLITGKFILRK
ncbi:gliding motility-associated C-terminal domain-containing protein [Lentimicrobium sp. S6]|uniref:T9SS type B sorting domain-containing protein n=1 Tax=Lentimicrobium sp. S6 TaxID=2735872 RepID=UPI001553663D|nr:PKD domain-containing protein [Lentimicrobium sp. S6]